MRSFRNKWWFAWLLIAIPLHVQPQTSQQAQDPPALVKVAVVRTIEMSPTMLVPGTVVSRDDARVAAEVDGRLIEVGDVGAPVKKGESLARIDDRGLSLEQAESKAVLIRETTALSFANQELKRLRGLVAKGLVSSSQLDQARSTRDVAQAEQQAAQAKLDLISDRISRTIIKAPFDGVITQRYRRIGEHVESGVQVLRLVNPAAVEVRTHVSASNLPFIPIGTKIVASSNGSTNTTTVGSVVPVGDDVSRLYEVRLNLAGNTWPAGTTVRVAIPTANPRQVTAVPRDALVLRTGGISVFKVNGDNQAVKVSVKTGVANDDMIEVLGEIEQGDRVVIRGNERLRPGNPVTLVGE